MKISVIVPVWNEEKTILNTLLSIQKQTLKPDEIIVVDNNSTDDTVKIAKQFKFVTVASQTKVQGLTPTRNKGFNIATGDLLLKIDADSELSPEWIEHAVDEFRNNKNLGGLSGTLIYGLPIIDKFLLYVYIYTVKLLTGTKPLLGPAYMIRKKSWEAIKNDICVNDHKVHEDVNLAIQLYKIGQKVEVFNEMRTFSSSRKIINEPMRFFITEYPMKLLKTILYR